MSVSLTSEYPDAFKLSQEKIFGQKEYSPKYAKHRKKEKKLLKLVKELQAQYLAKLEEIAEEKRLAEEARIAEEARKAKNGSSFFSKLGNAIILAIPAALTALFKYCAKSIFSRKNARKAT